jgi:hypothetical protein
MTGQKQEVPSECQNATVLDDGVDLNALDVGRIWSLRIVRSVQRRISRYFGKGCRKSSGTGLDSGTVLVSDSGANEQSSQWFRSGEIVEVLSFEEIKITLDDKGKCDGLEFMDGMKAFCGMRLPVKRKVTRMFDERTRRMLKMKKGRYILNDAICDGRDMYDREGCDRCCFYFWSDRWLRKLR